MLKGLHPRLLPRIAHDVWLHLEREGVARVIADREDAELELCALMGALKERGPEDPRSVARLLLPVVRRSRLADSSGASDEALLHALATALRVWLPELPPPGEPEPNLPPAAQPALKN